MMFTVDRRIYNSAAIYLWVVAQFELGLATDITAMTWVFDNAGHTSSRLRTLLWIARLAVTSRLLVLFPIFLLLGIIVVVVLRQHGTTQEADNNSQHYELSHPATLIV